MPPAPYPDFRWLFRSLRALPVVAIAALVGGIIGGFSVFALDLALTAPPNHDVGAEVGKITDEKAGNSAAAAPAAGTSAPPVPQEAAAKDTPPSSIAAPQPAPQAQVQSAPAIAVTPPLSPQQTTWPDALSRDHKSTPAAAAAVTSAPATPQPAAVMSVPAPASVPTPATPQQAPVTQTVTQTARVPGSASEQPAKTEVARKPIPAKRRVAIKRNAEPAASDGAVASTRTSRPVYDSYGRGDEASPPDAQARSEYSSRRYSVRHERAADDDDRSSDGDADQSDRGDNALPPQPAPPPLLFGLFGGGDRYDDR
jgi:hypothetical protein